MKITLIAMSGVRCRDEELMELGLTLPGFVERSKVIASLPSLGLLTLAGMLPDDLEADYLEMPEWKDGHELPDTAEVVAISSFSAQILEAYALADRLRADGRKVLLGGIHATLCPDEAQAHADALVIGEAEIVWPQLVADLKADRLQPRYDARSHPFDLAHSPMPRFDLLDPERYNRLTVQTQRGCPYSCEFCAASIRLQPKFRTKPVDRVMAEIAAIKGIWKHPFIEFADDNTFADKRHGRALCEALVGEGLRWFTETDISVARDPELLRLMKESGCAQVLVGLESPQAEGLEGIEQKANWKRGQRDRYARAIEAIQDAGITVNGCFVLGLDHTDAASFDAVFDFVEMTGLYEVQVTVMTPFPGTPLYTRLEREGRLVHPGRWDRCTLFDVNFVPQQMSVEELQAGFRDLVGRLYAKPTVEARRRRFFARQDQLRRARGA